MMKKLVLLMAVCAISAASFAGVATDINYSTDSGGKWQYDGVDTFEFRQNIGIDDVQGLTVDALTGQFIHLPDLTFISVSIADGLVEAALAPDSSISIQDAGGNILLEGTIGNGDFIGFNTISGAYSEFQTDIVVTFVDNSIGSDLLGSISVGTELDFNLTLQHRDNFADIIDDEKRASGTLSGSVTIIPEPATLAILALGSLLIRRRK